MTYTIPNVTDGSQGMESLVAGVSTQVPLLAPGILFLIWFVIMGAGYFAQERRTGAGNIWMWSSISGFITTAASFILYLYDKTMLSDYSIINITTIMISLVITIICVSIFLLSERN